MEEEVVEFIQPPSINKEEGLISSQTKKNKVSFYQKMVKKKTPVGGPPRVFLFNQSFS